MGHGFRERRIVIEHNPDLRRGTPEARTARRAYMRNELHHMF
jgi:hypothetical protein